MATAIVWYRRDLRVHDHPALARAAREFDHVVALFVLDPALLGGRYRSGTRTAFMLACLRALAGELRARGGALAVRHGDPAREVAALAREVRADAVLWTSDVSPYALARDRRVREALGAQGVQALPQGGNYVVDVSRPRTADGRPYTVFSPFLRRWDGLERRTVLDAPAQLRAPARLRRGRLPPVEDLGLAVETGGLPPAGEAAALAQAARWLEEGVGAYDEHGDRVARGSSGLSPHLRWGTLSPRELEQRAAALPGRGPAAFRRQLGWRDFYAHVLLHFPGNLRDEFQEGLRGLAWAPESDHLDAWRAGRTGYPLVDAGMRQLAHTGWMHNRARLVTGSFLVKDLHLDWRLGEAHYARLLLDGEPAQNNGNWQWIASTGVDPAPYFRRMFNPTLQQRRFDPDGAYVRRWVPELREVPAGRIFEPWTMSADEQRAAGCVIGRDYPAPIVDHQAERRRALELYRAASGG